MSRVSRLLSARRPGHKLLAPFFTAGFPDPAVWRALVGTAAAAGADIIEIGIPFSDPLADGPAIQFSSHCALRNGLSLAVLLDGIADLRARLDLPFILMGYYNPLLAYGEERFLEDAAAAGVDGLIIPDLPIEEAVSYRRAARRQGLSTVFLVAPTSTPERVKLIDKSSTDFVYAVTVTGVTGTGKTFGEATDAYLRRLTAVLTRPFVAGFGVNGPAAARRMARYADGVVIGSALVEVIRSAATKRQAATEVGRFLDTVRRVLP
ncbi:MAG TPA: tryptophan synthase subunit alpha [candidate division Zixibacteria bacterium]|nr:tryptophan synthase subunit alpha [candidate division Zixibacteria bacterium]MDD4918717.1 tryptophan synthase subunit alpha [candidate division Zixibacteria bacterium]MDM7973938.1 tryptophan synthase subunit alpha [candidate division Zixibacteria bacterium]HOD65779.1 tryptophan synthase subunit alpha [candidate division Zixibacteria bacterium]HOZ07085.1 tryptophan synthase subunit alpha [candidate division Zixibacteria bacterium]